MCLILFAYRVAPDAPLIVAANRDELFARPAAPAAMWADHPEILAGRDLLGGGTWLGISRRGRLAALTNFRDPDTHRADAPTRGGLVTDFLLGGMSARDYVDRVAREAKPFNGFCLLAWDGLAFYFYSNRATAPREIEPGIHGLPNALLDAPWPKVRKGSEGLERLVRLPFNADSYLDLLNDATPAPDADLPKRGRGIERERRSSALRIVDSRYGTRCSTVLRIGADGAVDFVERRFEPQGGVAGEARFRVMLESRVAD